MAIKLGDVNNSWVPPAGLTGEGKAKANANGEGDGALKMDTASAGSDPVTFTMPTTNGAPGTDVVVPIRVSSFVGVGTLQFSFHWSTNAVTFLT